MHLDFGFSLAELRRIVHIDLDGAWIDDSTRQRWSGEFSAGFDAARNAIK